jgi:hypothetical protein
MLLLAAAPAVAGDSDTCRYSARGTLDCDLSGTIPGDEPAPTGKRTKQPAPPPLRYLEVTAEGCYRWSRTGPGLDTWNIANEDVMYQIIFGTPRCGGEEPDDERAWRIFRTFPLLEPDPSLLPEQHGITGLPTILATANPTPITHFETLADGRPFEVRAVVASLTVDWGDGWVTSDAPADPSTHTYTTKTCPPEYRATHPSGPNCHPTLEAYPITATFTWWGEYRTGGTWIPIGTLDLTSTVLYDVDEVIGVLVAP